MALAPSELILNPDGSIYHLNLKPDQIATTIITVGDPDRVEKVTQYFDTIEFTLQKREFKTQTGSYRGKRITVISTGIGTDNIDIVLNELDALANIDFASREIKNDLVQLDIIRIGTSGSIQPDIPIDSFLVSQKAVGFDTLLHFYDSEQVLDLEIQEAIVAHTDWNINKSVPYVVDANTELLNHFDCDKITLGFTATNVGFYGPQGRKLRLAVEDPLLNTKLETFTYKNIQITNLEMETAGIYGLSKLLGHRALSLNAILANRVAGTFSKNPEQVTDELIQFALDRISSL